MVGVKKNIVILGASFGGLGTAHYIAKHILPKLPRTVDSEYVLHLVDPSTHFWWQIAAPRQIISLKELTLEQSFVPIMDGFKQYGDLKDSIVFHHGSAAALDTAGRSVTIALHDGSSESLEYHALIIATGVKSRTPLTTLQGDHTISQKALKDMNAKLATASEVVIAGGGPVGVEIAGEIATTFGANAKVTLISGGKKLLPVLSDSRASKAQSMLEKVGVTVILNTKVSGSEESPDGKTNVKLDNGRTLSVDVYIPAVGVTPNTDFLPANLKNKSGFVKTDPSTLRVDDAGARVYAAGDVAGVDTGGVVNMYSSLPVLHANIAHDLLLDAKVGNFAEKKYSFKPAETQIVPIGAKQGVGAFSGWSIPSFMIAQIKGKNYMIGNMGDFTEGKKFLKA